MGSYLLARADAKEAVLLVKGTLVEAHHMGVVHRPHLHVVVMNPGLYPAQGASFEDAILYEQSIPSDKRGWEHEYDTYARAKARASWHTGRPTDELQFLAPHLYEASDTTYYGSTIYRGLIVAASGVKPWYDVAFAGCVAHLLVAKAIGKMQSVPDDADFFHKLDVPRPELAKPQSSASFDGPTCPECRSEMRLAGSVYVCTGCGFSTGGSA